MINPNNDSFCDLQMKTELQFEIPKKFYYEFQHIFLHIYINI